MHIIGVHGMRGSGVTTAIDAMARSLLAAGYSPVREKWDDGISERIDAQLRFEKYDLRRNTPWHERVILIDRLDTMDAVNRVKKAGGITVFISAGRRLSWTGPPGLAERYEQGIAADGTFQHMISNNEGPILAFVRTVEAWVLNAVTNPKGAQ